MEDKISKDLKLQVRVNSQITAKEVRVVDENGQMLGIKNLNEALNLAWDSDLDLVEISSNAEPPVCKITDFGKYRYELQKKFQEAKKKQKIVKIKEIKLRPNIEDADYQVKVRDIRRFLQDGDKVRISLIFRGRENEHHNIGLAVIERIKEDLEDCCKVESGPKLEGRQFFMSLAPKS